MKITETYIQGLIILEPRVFEDDRGYFFESFKDKLLQENGVHNNWVQDNEAKSQKGVLRGLHYQTGEYAQAKLVRVVTGSVYDAVVDLRENSPTYGSRFGVILSAENKKQMLVPRGFAHGYLVLENDTIFSYKCDNYYNASSEGGLIFNDANIGIEWPALDIPFIISEKDKVQPKFGNHKPV